MYKSAIFVAILVLLSITSIKSIGTSGSQTGQCVSCIQSSSSYWCSMGPDETSGICCDSDESVQDCIGQAANPNDYICSNSERLPSNAEYLLCPQDTTGECDDTGDNVVSSSSSYKRADTGLLDPDILCKYKTNMSDSYTYPSSVTQFSDGSNQTSQVSRTIVSVQTDYAYYGNVRLYVYNPETKSFLFIDEHGGNYSTYRDYYSYATINATTSLYLYFHGLSSSACAGFEFNTTDDLGSQIIEIQQGDDADEGNTGGTDTPVSYTSQSAGGSGSLSRSDVTSVVLGTIVVALTAFISLLLFSLYKIRKQNLQLKKDVPRSGNPISAKLTSEQLAIEVDQVYGSQQQKPQVAQTITIGEPARTQQVIIQNNHA